MLQRYVVQAELISVKSDKRGNIKLLQENDNEIHREALYIYRGHLFSRSMDSCSLFSHGNLLFTQVNY